MRVVRLSFLLLIVASPCVRSLGAQAAANTSPFTAQVGPMRPAGALKRVLPPDPGRIDAWSPAADGSTPFLHTDPALQPAPESRRRNLLIGGVVGAVAGSVAAASICSDSDGVCLFSPAILLPLGGAGVGMIIALLLTPVH